MEPSQIISLNDNWKADYFELEPDLFEFGADAEPVADLSTWTCGGRYDETWGATLQRTFNLEVAEICVRYQLSIERAPGIVILYINGRRMGVIDGSQPFSFDVTDYVTLEDNLIVFRVECRSSASFGAVTLLQFPCES